MKKSTKWIIASFVILFIFPFLLVKFAGPNGMALCFIMFFAVNPIFFVIEGLSCGRKIKKFWFVPLDSALIYLLSMWIIFDFGETAFVMYSGVYLAIGIAGMLIMSAINHRKNERN